MIERGLSPEEARRQALLKFGNVALAIEDTQAVWTLRWLAQLRQDVRSSLRTIRLNPGLATVVIVTLALGIGATTAIFSLLDAVLLRGCRSRNQRNWSVSRVGGGTVSYRMYEAIRDRNEVLVDIRLTVLNAHRHGHGG